MCTGVCVQKNHFHWNIGGDLFFPRYCDITYASCEDFHLLCNQSNEVLCLFLVPTQILKVYAVSKENATLEPAVHYGSDVTLVCKVRARPHPVITWSLRDSEYSPDVQHLSPILWKSEHAIKQVSCKDTGTYLCRAGNYLSNLTESIDVSVLGKFLLFYTGKLEKRKPEI